MIRLSQRQLGVLRWIGDGCPDRDWPDQSHKLTARSLAGKGLADVRCKKKIWTATITAADQYYLEHGQPPPSRESGFEPTSTPAPRRQPSGRRQPLSSRHSGISGRRTCGTRSWSPVCR